MKLIPYGQGSYETVATNNFYYVDKTPFIETIEKLDSRFLFFLRPRRFGKSLFVSMLKHYYDINRKDDFEELFGNTYIGKNPTPLHNTYPILYLNFSGIKAYSNIQETILSFNRHVNESIEVFLINYEKQFNLPQQQIERILEIDDAADQLRRLLTYLSLGKVKFLFLLDEYDNFANNILIDFGKKKYEDITHGTGFLRNFFAVIKNGTESAKIDRLLITGVSPLVMADVTSGYNIGDNISIDLISNSMVGFTESEVIELIDYYVKEKGIKEEDKNTCIELIKKHYGGYRFSYRAKEEIYNADMVLFFVKEYLKVQEIPTDLLDENVRTDYEKLSFLITENKRINGNFNVLADVLAGGETRGELVRSFSVKELTSQNNFRSLLYYLGLTTIKSGGSTKFLRFKVPNRIIAKMMWDYIRRAVNETFELKINSDYLIRQFENMALYGDWKPALNYIIKEKFYDAMSIRDFSLQEVGCKGFILAYLNLSPFYVTDSEKEIRKGYTDVFMYPDFTSDPDIKYAYIVELKFLKAEQIDKKEKRQSAIESAFDQAKIQLKQYSEKLGAETKKIVIIISTKELLLMEEVY